MKYDRVKIAKIQIRNYANPLFRNENTFLSVEWEGDGKKGMNHYTSGVAPFDFNEYLGWFKEAKLI